MAGQFIALLLAGLLATQLLGIALLRLNAQMLNPVSRDQVLDRLVIAWRLLQNAPAGATADLLEAVASPSARFWIGEAPPTPDRYGDEEQRLLASLQQRLGRADPTGLWTQLGQPEDGPWLCERDPQEGWCLVSLHTAIQLGDGRWLHSAQHPLAGYQWWRLLRFSLPASTLPVLLIALFVVWKTLRPIKELARAAERVSHGERVPPLPPTGPQEVREVSAAFNLMQDKLRRFVDDRTQMLAAISHDFRTPITSLRLRAELVDDPLQRAAMVRTLDDMRVMVEQTLSFTQDEGTREATQDIDLQALLLELQATRQTLGQPVTLAPAPAEAPRYRGQPVSLKRALRNLVDNAVRHGGSAHITLTQQAPSGWRIAVDDAGPGLPEDMLERVFVPFVQLGAARNREQGGGVGLGLAIARSCARAHGGDVTLANRPEGGLRATISLP
ncbi:MAG: HAMP domain-containing protein [Comamonadaceae bacterium]|nr:MAG: HAMP domain-containing protein [Comamonadaceae bacterium]